MQGIPFFSSFANGYGKVVENRKKEDVCSPKWIRQKGSSQKEGKEMNGMEDGR